MQYLNKVWLANRSTAWLLALNVVLVTLVSLVFVEHFPSPTNALEVFYQLCLLPSIWGLYAFLVLFLLVPLNFIPRFRYVSMLLVAYLGGSLAIMVYIDNYIYEIYNYHINWFFVEAYWADEGGEFFDVSMKTYLTFSFVAFLVLCIELLFIWLVATKITQRKVLRFAGLTLGVLVLFQIVAANVIHSWAYAKNYAPITSIGAHLPFYFPVHSRSLASSEFLTGLTGTEEGGKSVDNSTIYYPRSPMQCETSKGDQPNVIMVVLESWRGDTFAQDVTPNMYELAQESLWFKNHHSSGNVTTRGIFSLMYGLAPTYMDNVVANNGVGGPVLLNELIKRNYKFGIFPSGDIARMKLADSSFLPVKKEIQHGEGSSVIDKDRDILAKMTNMLADEEGSLFGFMFFNSSHYQYYYPKEFEKFKPVKAPSLIDFKQGKDPLPYVNHYKNSLYFVDSLVGDLIGRLKESGRWANTILIVTSDHGEEFADTKATRFGHGSNYTSHQTHVPLVIHWPDKKPKVFDHRTASVDVAATLLNEALACKNEIADYSSGESLFNLESRKIQIMASYYDYAFVTEQGSFTQNPIGLLDSRNNKGEMDSALSLDPGLAFSALEKMKWFYSKPK